jgi:hypothetical protein
MKNSNEIITNQAKIIENSKELLKKYIAKFVYSIKNN